MGVALSRSKVDFEITVKTGDVKGAGTDSNVYCVLVDINGNQSRNILLDCKWRNDFEKGNIDKFRIRNVDKLDHVEEIILWRDQSGLNDDWYVEYIFLKQNTVVPAKHVIKDSASELEITEVNNNDIENENKNEKKFSSQTFVSLVPFPCNRWIHPNRKYRLVKYDSVLPQFDKRKEQREYELDDKKNKYSFGGSSILTPRRVAKCPTEENFSNDYKWDIIGKKMKFLAQKRILKIMTTNKWENLNDLLDVYTGSFGVPYGYYNWKSDIKFGQQRLRGCNPAMIKLMKEIPENFAITDELLSPFLEGKSIEEAIEKKSLYIVDLNVLNGIVCKGGRNICCPFGLFYVNSSGDFLPIGIQLYQTPSEKNPVFTPNDPPYTWMLAKMYYNNAECCLHQTCTHLGFTHLVVESICGVVHQTLSPSHPVFRLLAPHFLYLIAINSLAVEKLLAPEGWIDVTMTMGVCGLFDILKRKWKDWRFDVDGWLPADLAERGVEDEKALPDYMYRDDSLLLHKAILDYVTEIVNLIYKSKEMLQGDHEIQSFAKYLVDEEKGAAIKGVFGGGAFNEIDDLVKTLTGIIFLSSVGHAAANFCQYDEYAFPPNYPATLKGCPPTSKMEIYTEKDIIDHLPSKDTTLSIMVVTKILSDRGTNGLGDFEVQYMYEPKAVEAVKRFQQALKKISEHIKSRNATAKDPYPYLDPENIPNAISI